MNHNNFNISGQSEQFDKNLVFNHTLNMHKQNQNNKMFDIFRKCVEQIKLDRSKLTCDPMTETAKRAAVRIASAAEQKDRQRRVQQ